MDSCDYYYSEEYDSDKHHSDEYPSGEEDVFDKTLEAKQKNYAILTVEDIDERQQKDIKVISSVLSISRDSASMLLRYYNWNAEDAQAAWVMDTKKVCKDVGLLHIEDIKSLEAKECTQEPHRPIACETVTKWVVKISGESENTEISEESENTNWILANSKPCPKCKRPIEKNNGCMHMTCTPPCKYQFCWLCLRRWSKHGEETGGFYACNRYEAENYKEGVDEAAEHEREMAKNSLEKYTFFYERWAANQSSRKKALDDLNKMQTKYIAKFGKTHVLPETYFDFIIDAWCQIIECRRLLMWTYAYGYYLPDQELVKKQFFEDIQGEAEQRLEQLHLCAEKEVFTLYKKKAPQDEIDNFRTKLVGLTSVTCTYFENLVKALDNGLSEDHSMVGVLSPEEKKVEVTIHPTRSSGVNKNWGSDAGEIPANG
ncbi:zinc finger, RanBP2-type [Artemisia annua]|uniref:Zinc finger, RanBP2-type n=1 Tax=Artemisia annua TaxID=35608 RepID=A0A2U1KLM1_ARTAN|nr:zinc finger, RanBP2-type [Artemisia annua]